MTFQDSMYTALSSGLRKPALGMLVFLAFGISAKADLVTNGSFESATCGFACISTLPNGQVGYNTTVTGWATSSYTFLYSSGTADGAGSATACGSVGLSRSAGGRVACGSGAGCGDAAEHAGCGAGLCGAGVDADAQLLCDARD